MNPKRLCQGMVAILVVLLLVGCSTSRITGVVKQSGTPLENVKVTLGDLNKSPYAPPEQQTKTDPDGHFKFRNVKPGDYIVMMLIENTTTQCYATLFITVEDGKTVEANLELEQDLEQYTMEAVTLPDHTIIRCRPQ